MKRGSSRLTRCIAAAACIASALSCESHHAYLQRLDEGFLPPDSDGELPPSRMLKVIASWEPELDEPWLIAAVGAPSCIVAVGYPAARTVEMRDLNTGAVRRLLDGGGRAPTRIGSLSAVTLSTDGTLIIGDGARSVLHVYRGPNYERELRVPLKPHLGRISPSDIAAGPGGRIAVRSALEPLAIVSAERLADLYSWTGTRLSFDGSVGDVRPYPTGAFTAALNNGYVALADSMLVLGNSADGTVWFMACPEWSN